MSAMSSQKRKIAKKDKERMAIIRAAHKPQEFLKHRANAKAIRAEVERREPEAERSSSSPELEYVMAQ